jgi:hypothetical protein
LGLLAVARSLRSSRWLDGRALLAARRTSRGLSRCGRSLLLSSASLALGWRLCFFVVIFLVGGLASSALGLDFKLMSFLDNGLAALRELNGWIGLVASLLDLIALVRGYGNVVRLDFLDRGRWVTSTPVPGCYSMSAERP